MNEILIEDLAYLLKEAKQNNEPQPIFFLGAGASASGNIPLAHGVAEQILSEYSDNPFIKKLPETDRGYSQLMDCLSPYQRNQLLTKYIDEAKINVTHIYLAQLLVNGFADYVLTVNFDNLMLRALALYNEFPPTYDMAVLKDLTTTSFKEKSVVYLHGKHHGLWLLNTEEEMNKVKGTVPRIFDSIKNNRPWIFIGYSASDPIFEHIKNLGRFDNGLYWVGYRDYEPNENTRNFLSTPNTNTGFIKGYDSDSFMLKLNEEIGLGQPPILDKPFSALHNMLLEVNDINDEDHFKGVKERLEIAKNNVSKSIDQFEKGEIKEFNESDIKASQLNKEIIDSLISETYSYERVTEFEEEAMDAKDHTTPDLIAHYYFGWGTNLGDLAESKQGNEAEELYQQAFDKFKKATLKKPDKQEAFFNWGTNLGKLAESKQGNEAEELYQQAFNKLKKAIEIEPNNPAAFNNWGIYLAQLAKNRQGSEAEELYQQSFSKFEKAIEIRPRENSTFYNWANNLGNLAESKQGKDAEELYQKAFDKFEKAIEIKPDDYDILNNWGVHLANLAKNKEGNEGEELYQQAFDKFKKAIEIEPNNPAAFNNWGVYLANLAKNKQGSEAEELYQQAFGKFKKAIEIRPDMNEAFNNWGLNLAHFAEDKHKNEAEKLYLQAFDKFKKAIEIKPNDHEAFFNWGTYLGKQAENKEGDEGEILYKQAFDKFKKAIKIKPDKHMALYNWGSLLCNLAKKKEDNEAKKLYKQAFGILNQGIEMGGRHYNLSCLQAVTGQKEQALMNLELSLSNNDIKSQFVREDEDWQGFLTNDSFQKLLAKFE